MSDRTPNQAGDRSAPDCAVQILCDLRDLDAGKPGKDFPMRLQASSKSSFLKRLSNAGL
jgi:hypothetical protein